MNTQALDPKLDLSFLRIVAVPRVSTWKAGTQRVERKCQSSGGMPCRI